MRLNEIEKKAVILFSKPRSKFLDLFSSIISSVPLLIVFWLIVAILAIIENFIEGAIFTFSLAIVFLLHFIISEGVIKWGSKKTSKQRIRPYVLYPEEIVGIGKNFSDSSFPSSHVAAMVGGLYALVNFYPNFFFVSAVVILIMGWSRIRNGMHYPTDILAGIILGLLYGYLALMILNILI